MIVVWLCIAVPLVCLQFVIVVFPDHTHLLFVRLSTEIYTFATSLANSTRDLRDCLHFATSKRLNIEIKDICY